MALTGLSTQTEFLPTVRFNAREGIFSRADRIMDSAGNYGNKLTDITDALAEQGILIDVANIEIGWIRFEGGVDITTQHHSLGLPGPQAQRPPQGGRQAGTLAAPGHSRGRPAARMDPHQQGGHQQRQ